MKEQGRRWAALMAAMILLWMVSFSQDSSLPTTPETSVSVATVEAALAAMEADTGLEQGVKELLRPKFQLALDTLKTEIEFATKAAALQELVRTGPEQAAELKAQLEAFLSGEGAPEAATHGTSEDLQKKLDSLRLSRASLEDEFKTVTTQLAQLKKRPVEISGRLPVAQRELADTQQALAAETPAGEAALSAGETAKKLLLQTKEVMLGSELELIRQEQLTQAIREEILEAERNLLQWRIETAALSIATLEAAIEERLAGEARAVVSAAVQSPWQIKPDDTDGQELLAEVQALAKEFETVVESLTATSKLEQETKIQRERLIREHEFLEEQLNLGGSGEMMANALFLLQDRLPTRWELVNFSNKIAEDLSKARLGVLQVEEKLRSRAEVEERFASRSDEGIRRLLNTREEVLNKLSTQYDTLIRALASLHLEGLEYNQRINKIRIFVFQELFRVRSSPPVGIDTVRNLPAGVKWLFAPSRWTELAGSLLHGLALMRVLSGLFALFIVGPIVWRGRLIGLIEGGAASAHGILRDDYLSTIKVLLASVLLSLPIPLFLLLSSWAIDLSPYSDNWLRGISRGLDWSVLIALWLSFLSVVCREGGLGVEHFGWNPAVARRIRASVNWFIPAVIPLVTLCFVTFFAEGGRYFDSIGRLSLILLLFWMVFLLRRLLRDPDTLFDSLIQKRPESLFVRTRKVWIWLMISIAMVLLWLALTGYVVTSLHLVIELLLTVGLIIAGILLYYTMMRWFAIRERRFAVEEGFKSDEGKRADQSVGVDSIAEQTRHLFRSIFLVLVVVLVGLLWSQTIPVYQMLAGVQLFGGLTLLEVAKAILLLVLGYILVHDMPGLLELAVLRATRIQAGTRAAITTLCQYAVVTIVLVLLFNILQVDWSKFGWIAAALSVGLGFGLQEVVANFVCGLILLFELPIRVGDIVTVNGLTGTVTRIHMRATTILNWDRQEYVVPNKTFITNAFLNWTLSNSINRVVVSVGVAYGSDTAKACRILFEVAKDNPLVTRDPEPVTTFDEFGDSTLNLTLRCYLPNIENRLRVISELHSEIDRRFKEAGIEIAFPQRDLNIRSWVAKTPPEIPHDGGCP